jgi:L-malate glycosyltransferase
MSDPRRVAYVIWSLGLGGAEQMVIRLAAGLDRQRFQPLVVCLNEAGPFAEEARRTGTEVVALHKRGRYDVTVLGPLVRLLRDRRTDLVHTHLWGANLWGRIGALLSRRRPSIVATEHNTDTWKRPYHLAIDRVLCGRTTHLVAVSRHVAEFYERHHVGTGRWRIVPNGVDVERPAPTRAQARSTLGVAPDSPLVGFVGRFASAKAPEVFLEAVAHAARAMPALRVVMIGDGPLRPEVEKARARHALDGRVVLTGMRNDVRDLLPAFDALLFCSEREGLSVAMLEAMAAGVPVLATPVGGTTELVEADRTGILVPVGRPEAMAGQLVGLLGAPARAERLRQAARERVAAQFSLRRTVEAHESLYASCFAP